MPITPPPTLIRHMRDGRCVLFAGAGLSAAAGLPTWTQLLKEIIAEVRAEAPDSTGHEELDRLLAAGKQLEVADHCKEKLGATRYSRILSDRLRGDTVALPAVHRAAASLPFAAVVTTNYDKLLERAFAEARGGLPKVPTHADIGALGPLLFDEAFFVLKAHGEIDRPETLVLTAADYRRIIHANPAFDSLFSALLMTKAILFLGYSLSDPDFRLLLDRQFTAFEGQVPERYAVMAGVGPVERDLLFRGAGIRVLPYPEGQHEELVAFLEALNVALDTKPVPAPAPAARRSRSRSRSAGLRELPPPEAELTLRLAETSVHATLRVEGEPVSWNSPPVDWAELTQAIQPAMSEWLPPREACLDLGPHLARYLPVEAIRAVAEDTLIRLKLAPEVEKLPWELARVADMPFALRHPIARGPAAMADSARGQPSLRPPFRVLVIGDPTESVPLPGARAEALEIGELYRGVPGVQCTTLIGEQATFDAAVAALQDGHDIIHFAGHAWFGPQESYLVLDRTDTIVRAGDVRWLLGRRPPAILVLNSHYTAFVPPGAHAKESDELPHADAAVKPILGGHGGFTQTAWATGVGTFIGCFGSPGDQPARVLAVTLHRELIAGAPIATALLRARRALWTASDTDATALLYALSGAPDYRLG